MKISFANLSAFFASFAVSFFFDSSKHSPEKNRKERKGFAKDAQRVAKKKGLKCLKQSLSGVEATSFAT